MTLPYRQAIEDYLPACPQEEADRAEMLAAIGHWGDAVLTRSCTLAHITPSCFVVNGDASKVLMAYHIQRDCWAWPGGHADGEGDMLAVARKELAEETGLHKAKTPLAGLFSLDVLPVYGHLKRGQYVGAHLHLSTAVLFVADEDAPLQTRPGENTAVAWKKPAFLSRQNFDECDTLLYQKLLARAQALLR